MNSLQKPIASDMRILTQPGEVDLAGVEFKIMDQFRCVITIIVE